MPGFRTDMRKRASFFRSLVTRPSHELGRKTRWVVHQFWLWKYCIRQLNKDRFLTVAGDLTFKTLLSLIPMLVLFLLVISFVTRGPDTGHRAMNEILRAMNIHEMQIVVDDEEVDLAGQMDRMVGAVMQRINTAAVVGMFFLIMLALEILMTVEENMNRIWKSEAKRPLWKKIGMFIMIMLIAPVVIASAIQASVYIIGVIEGIDLQATTFILPWLLTMGRWGIELVGACVVLFLLYRYLPSTQVSVRAALTGALVAGVLWHVIAKNAFALYIRYAVGVRYIYGSLAVIPIFIIWIYITWIFVLFGCELAYVIQNFRTLALDDRKRKEE